MKIKSMPQLMNPQEQDREIEVFRRLSLGPRAYEEYYPYNNNTELAFTIRGQDVYVQKGYSDTTFYALIIMILIFLIGLFLIQY